MTFQDIITLLFEKIYWKPNNNITNQTHKRDEDTRITLLVIH